MTQNSVVSPENAVIASKTLAGEGKKIAQGGAIVMLATIIAQGLGMATTIWIARALGPDQYGLLTLSLSVLLPVSTLAALGLDKTVVRFIPIHIGRHENNQVAGTLFGSLLIGGLVSLLVMVAMVVLAPQLALLFEDERLTPVLRLLALTVPLTVLATIAVGATRGLKVMHYDAAVKIARPLFRLLTWIGGFFLLANLFRAAIYASLLEGVFTLAVALGLTYWGFKRFLGHGVRWSMRPLLFYSLPLVLSTLMYALTPRIDRLVLGVVADTRLVGVYSGAASLILILKLVHSSITMTFSPIVADAYNRISVDRARNLYLMVTRWDARLTFLVAVSAILLAQEVLWLFGQAYAEAITPFLILALSVYVSVLPGPTGAFLQMTNRQRIDAINAVLFFVLSPLLQYALALWLGWIGVAVGVLVSIVFLNALQVLEIKHFYGFHPFVRRHLVFSVISLFALIGCLFAGYFYPLPLRLLLLAVVLLGLGIFVYWDRTPSDALILEQLLPQRWRRRSKEG